jgi:hypothetical protein
MLEKVGIILGFASFFIILALPLMTWPNSSVLSS